MPYDTSVGQVHLAMLGLPERLCSGSGNKPLRDGQRAIKLEPNEAGDNIIDFRHRAEVPRAKRDRQAEFFRKPFGPPLADEAGDTYLSRAGFRRLIRSPPKFSHGRSGHITPADKFPETPEPHIPFANLAHLEVQHRVAKLFDRLHHRANRSVPVVRGSAGPLKLEPPIRMPSRSVMRSRRDRSPSGVTAAAHSRMPTA